MNTARTDTGRSGAQLVSAFSCCSDDAKNSDGGYITGLAIDQSQRILAVDNEAGTVKVFDQIGKFLYSFGKGLLVEPWDCFVTSSGKIAVSDPGAGDIKVFSTSGKYLLNSERGFHLNEPYGIDYHLWTKETAIADGTLSCVFLHAPNGKVKDVLSNYGCEPEVKNIKAPNYVCFDSSGNVYVTDKGLNSLHAYDTEGKHIFTYGYQGKGEEELNNPCGVVTDRFGNIIVADRDHSRVHLLDKYGRRKMALLTWEDGIVEPQAMTLNSEGHLVLSEGSTGLIKVFSYTHLEQVTAELTPIPDKSEDIPEIDPDLEDIEALSLSSGDKDDGHEGDTKCQITQRTASSINTTQSTPKRSTTKVNMVETESFKRSLQLLTSSGEDYKQSLGFGASKSSDAKSGGWSQMSSNYFSSVPSSAMPRGPHIPEIDPQRPNRGRAKERIDALNRDLFTESSRTGNATDSAFENGISLSTPNIRNVGVRDTTGQSP